MSAEKHRLLGAPVPIQSLEAVEFFGRACRAIERRQSLDREPLVDHVDAFEGLNCPGELEDLSKIAMLARWLGRRWPDPIDLSRAELAHASAGARIAQALVVRAKQRLDNKERAGRRTRA